MSTALDANSVNVVGLGDGLGSFLRLMNTELSRWHHHQQQQPRKDGAVVDIAKHPRFRRALRRIRDAAKRDDSFTPQGALATARQLEHVYSEVLRETFATPNGLTIFPIDGSVSEGARTHTVERYYEAGTAKVYRAGEPVPFVSLSKADETFNIRHYVNGSLFDLFEAMSTGYVNVSLASELLRVQRDSMLRFANERTWYGSDEDGIYGVLNYPWLAKYIESQAFNSAASPLDVLNALHRIANYPSDNYRGAMSPNVMAMSHRLFNYISSTSMAADDGTTILQRFLQQSAYITEVISAWELSGVGPAGADGILAYRRDRLGITNVVVRNFTPIPVQQDGFESRQLAYMTHGGVIMREQLNNILAWVEGPAGLTS